TLAGKRIIHNLNLLKIMLIMWFVSVNYLLISAVYAVISLSTRRVHATVETLLIYLPSEYLRVIIKLKGL
ncbi:hypothetical protein M2O40_004474, partial [Kluyvera ascorbata]